MVSSFLSSFYPFKKSNKRRNSSKNKRRNSSKNKRRISLDSLPEDLLVEVSSYTGALSLSSVRNLRLVSKTFRKTCDETYVISRLSLHELPLFHWSKNQERFSNFFERCRRHENPEALYRKGLISYFLENQKQEGFNYLTKAAGKGNKEANYVYGMILICGRIPEGTALLGGETKQEGFKVLSSLMKPLMSKTLKELVELRDKIRGKVWWRGIPVMKELKSGYVQEKCKCDGRTSKFIAYNCVWHRYGEDNDMNTSCACVSCLWNHEVQRFFDNIPSE
ncbi:unnamed protein product [Eruca vesicaria subsp. sativa]|uniref:At2g35280-like TPR domain-containing protein n=1 Tax=Eruca vesicaria subsp. sativa TaxID=29727 RepID=A0ABC8LGR1_ERUVS|nr:unnamed protein product [Eruca vesicaria subsp. sativa]